MPVGRDFLSRFRPAGAPGSAARAAVPADRTRELADELEPVLALLDSTDAECQQIVARAGQEAARIRAAARADAERIAAEAACQARAATDEAARRVLTQARAQAAEATTAADEQARLVGQRAARRLPALVARAVALVQAGPPPDAVRDAASGQGAVPGTGDWSAGEQAAGGAQPS